jgi:hypothetical protein
MVLIQDYFFIRNAARGRGRGLPIDRVKPSSSTVAPESFCFLASSGPGLACADLSFINAKDRFGARSALLPMRSGFARCTGRAQTRPSTTGIREMPVNRKGRLNPGCLRFASARAYIPGMFEIEHWRRRLRDAEAELEAARTRTQVNAAAKKLQRAKAELRELEVSERQKRVQIHERASPDRRRQTGRPIRAPERASAEYGQVHASLLSSRNMPGEG